jgi:hypothetical protein
VAIWVVRCGRINIMVRILQWFQRQSLKDSEPNKEGDPNLLP